MRVQWKILCDFDGTVSLQDVTDTLLERLGQPGWRALEEDWVAGRIGARECMSGQVALLDGDVDALHRVLDEVRIDPAFVRFVDLARDLGMPLSIVSDGLDYPIARILARYGLHQHLLTAIAYLHGQLLGSDITGEVSEARYPQWWKRRLAALDAQPVPSPQSLAAWQAQQHALNLRLLEAVAEAGLPR